MINDLVLSSTEGDDQDVTYETYCSVIASLNPEYQVAFDFKVPTVLHKLWADLKELGQILKDTTDISWQALVVAFKEKSVFTLLKGVGFAVSKLLKAVVKASQLPSNALFHALADMKEMFGSSKLFRAMNVKMRLEKLDALTKKHPVLTKLTGVAVSGFLIWMFIHATFTGHPDRDLELVDTVVACLKGSYDLADLFTSDSGVYALTTLVFGLAGLGIPSLISESISTVAQGLDFLGEEEAGIASGLLLALFYSAAKRLKLKIDFHKAPRVLATASAALKGRT